METGRPARPRYQRSAEAREPDERIEAFLSDATTGGLPPASGNARVPPLSRRLDAASSQAACLYLAQADSCSHESWCFHAALALRRPHDHQYALRCRPGGSPAAALGNLRRRFLGRPAGTGADTARLPPSGFAYRWRTEPDLGGSAAEREVVMAAHEGSEHAENAERRDIGDATLEQIRTDVIRLSRDYMTDEPFMLFCEIRRARSQVHARSTGGCGPATRPISASCSAASTASWPAPQMLLATVSRLKN
jgi:hypothetical protein